MNKAHSERFAAYGFAGIVSTLLAVASLPAAAFLYGHDVPVVIRIVQGMLLVAGTTVSILFSYGMLVIGRRLTDVPLQRSVVAFILTDVLSLLYGIIIIIDPAMRESTEFLAGIVTLMVTGALSIVSGVRLRAHPQLGLYGRRLGMLNIVSGVMLLIPLLDVIGIGIALIANVYAILLMYAIARGQVTLPADEERYPHHSGASGA